uniref:Probable UDP-N-acetylglucosamine--peptide N-acetylglucosaminyltransferase SPINDLY n=1 Tax=Arcella intermedia TaxID=1963864 RepID=A0A6B2KYC6_9EUKA
MLLPRNLIKSIELFDEVLKHQPDNLEALYQKGLCSLSLGKTEEAYSFVSKALEIAPNDCATLIAMSIVYKTKDLYKSVKYLRRAIKCDPSSLVAKQTISVVLTDLGTLRKVSGHPEEGLKYYLEALSHVDTYAPAWYNIGIIHAERNDYHKAMSYFQKAIEYHPRYSEAYSNMGVVLKELGKNREAIQYYQKALNINPNIPLAKFNISLALSDLATQIKLQGNLKEAKSLYKQALFYNHRCWNATYNLAVIFSEEGRMDRALYYYHLTLEFNPECAIAYNNMGVIEKNLGNFEMAIKYYKKALEINPKIVQTLNNLGTLYMMQGLIEESYHYLKRAVEEDSSYVEAYNNIGILCRDEADIEKALYYYQKCIQLDPHTRNAGHNQLLTYNYLPDFDPELQYKIHDEWARRFSASYKQYNTYNNSKQPNKTLKIGYISPDFFVHSVSYFIECMLKHYDKGYFQVFCYSNVARPDSKTEKFQGYVDKWRKVDGVNSCKVAEWIREDGIDILIELAGHTAGNRLDVMAHKPAPIQITWIGYPNTTGLKTIDYRFTDETADPVNTVQKFSEKLIRLPNCFLCYTPIDDPPPISPLPYLNNGFITFGSFNNLAKMTPLAFATWAEILKAVPKSRLVLKSKSFISPSVRSKILKIFTQHGLDTHQVDLLPLTSRTLDHLSSYALMDFSLDTFPYAGTTTTCEALFMGVPVITLLGGGFAGKGPHAGNVGVTLLKRIQGMEEFICESVKDYINTAVKLAGNIPLLVELRAGLRGRLLESSLCDGKNFCKDVESEYRNLWRQWCQ